MIVRPEKIIRCRSFQVYDGMFIHLTIASAEEEEFQFCRIHFSPAVIRNNMKCYFIIAQVKTLYVSEDPDPGVR